MVKTTVNKFLNTLIYFTNTGSCVPINLIIPILQYTHTQFLYSYQSLSTYIFLCIYIYAYFSVYMYNIYHGFEVYMHYINQTTKEIFVEISPEGDISTKNFRGCLVYIMHIDLKTMVYMI